MAPLLLKSVVTSSKKHANDIVEKALSTVESIEKNYAALFPYSKLSDAKAKFGSVDVTSPNVVDVVTATSDLLDEVLTTIVALERYVMLSLPKIEDGNNFGVTVQLAALKQLKDDREFVEKALDEMSKYYVSRADAMEKCKLPSISKSKTTSGTSSNGASTGGEKGDTKTTNTEQKTEEKAVETETTLAEGLLRKEAVVSVDVLYYSKAKTFYQRAATCYLTAIDFMDKNKDKLEKPKGTQGGGPTFSMY